ncbi:alpha/beta hydrolase [Enterococcus sp. LJL128]|uniref:alpha/beta hydrolase n=1 Tax=Enterococcus sp. LJL51 TaxID=3416656 RepID=UPI003CED2F7A
MAFFDIDYYSAVLGMNTKVSCILPNNGRTNIPVLYLLHGVGGDYTSWSRFTALESYVDKMNLAVIMPQTSAGAYTNTTYHMNYWTYLSDELPKTVQNFFPQLSKEKEKNYAGGQSLGGYGAFKLGFGTDNYGAIISLSGAVHSMDQLGEEIFQFAPKAFWTGIFGNLDELPGSENDIYALAEKKLTAGFDFPDIYLACGTEDPFFPANQKAVELLKPYGINVQLRATSGGHDWLYWNQEIKQALAWLSER